MRGNDNKNKGVQKKQKNGLLCENSEQWERLRQFLRRPGGLLSHFMSLRESNLRNQQEEKLFGSQPRSSEVVPELRSEARSGFN